MEAPAQPLNLPTLAQVFGRKRMAELVHVNPETHPLTPPLKEFGDCLHSHRPAICLQQWLVAADVWPSAVQVTRRLQAQSPADRYSPEFEPAQLTDTHPGPEQG